jgi:type IV pilus assembly protein PilN
MIRINLLGAERQTARKAPVVDLAQRVTALCSLVLVLAGAVIGWWYWSLRTASAQVDSEIAAAQQEAARLKSVLAEVQEFENRRSQLQQRVALIEELRSGQSIPVQVLDHVSRSLPETLWLTTMNQEGATLTIEGRSTTLIALSDFVGNLGGTELLEKPIEIVTSRVEASRDRATSVELIHFVVKAKVTPAPGAKTAAPASATGKRAEREPRAAKAARS